MAVRTKEEIMEIIRKRIGDSTTDADIKIIEDVSDTLADYEAKIKGDGVDWKTKFEENDAAWRQKYKDRFFSDLTDYKELDEDEARTNKKELTYESLFEEE